MPVQVQDLAEHLFQRHPQAMCLYAPVTLRLLAANDAFVVDCGHSQDQLRSMSVSDFVPIENAEADSHAVLFKGEQARLLTITHTAERRQTDAAQQQDAERGYRSIFENAVEGIFQTSPGGRYLSANPALARIYGYDSPEELMAHMTDISHQLYVSASDRARFAQLLQDSDAVTGFEAQVFRKDGSRIWISEHARAVRDVQGRVRYYEGMVEDITERKRLEAERERLLQEAIERADRDPLTGLWNHRAFHNKLQEEAERATREGSLLAVAVMDLDNFKFFNDAYGHAVGDEVLRLVAAALQQCCRATDILARFGGDEFALLLPGTSREKALRLTDRLHALLAGQGYHPPGGASRIPLSLSIGVAVLPEDGWDRLQVLEAADTRLIRSKSGGGEEKEAEHLRDAISHQVQGFSMLDALVTAVDNKDRYTRRHSEDVMAYSLHIAAELDLDEHTRRTLAIAALLHDVGKIGVPDRILRKPGALTPEEFDAVRQHPIMGAVIVGAVPGLEDTLDAIRHHHECWDGTGYPAEFHGKNIPHLARILAVADAFSAMTMDRPYRKGLRRTEALHVLEQGAGTQWDPQCVQAFRRACRAYTDRLHTSPADVSASGPTPFFAKPSSPRRTQW